MTDGEKENRDEEPENDFTITDEDADNEEEENIKKVKRYVSWTVGAIILLTGLSNVQYGLQGVVSAILYAGVAMLVIPPTRTRIFDSIDYDVSRAGFAIILLAGITLAGATLPDAATTESPESSSNVQSSEEQSQENRQPAENNQQQAQSGGTGESEGIFVRIIYSGSWQGSISTDTGRSRSIEGTGTERIKVTGDDIERVAANAQKQDDSGATLTIQIIEEGEVLGETQTSADYGVAQVTADVNDWF